MNVDDILMSDPYINDITMMIGVRNIFVHMLIKDCYEAGLMSEDVWKDYLRKQMGILGEEG